MALLVLLAVVGLAVIVVRSALGDGEATRAELSEGRPAAAPAPPPPELPRGGRRLFPDFRVVAFYGAPQAEELGALGIGTPRSAGAKLVRQARAYAKKTRPALPAFELISTIVTAAPGADGKYRSRQEARVIRRYLRAARRIKALLILDLQPGRATFPEEFERVRRWMREPDVGLALDPEWRMEAGQVPGQQIGSVSAAEVNQVSRSLAAVVRKYRLPEKLLLIHQFTDDMIRDKGSLQRRPGLAITINVDGFGDRANKLSKWRSFTSEAVRFHDGYKLFYKEDTDLMQPRDVLRMQPRPDLVVYE